MFGPSPTGAGVPLDFAPGSAPGGTTALGNWNGNAGHVALQDTAQLSPSQHDVFNMASGGNVMPGTR
ncbi:hypothetical protein [Streptomyces sp. NPDC087300]|uniref:hypothetical protein n=1 Tax=Streptomyces sp. NPDC087300 TaxID=3365780 RepID=UPI0037F1C7C5